MQFGEEKKASLYPRALFLGLLSLALWVYLEESRIIPIAYFLSIKLHIGKLIKASILLSMVRFLRSALGPVGYCLVVYGLGRAILPRYMHLVRAPSDSAANSATAKLGEFLDRNFFTVSFALIVLVTGILYYPSLSFGFLNDDFCFIWRFHAHKAKVFLPWLKTQGPSHYAPVGMVFAGLPSLAFGFSPFWFHLEALLLHALNCFIILVLCHRLTRSKLTSLAAGMFFLTYGLNFEVAFWITAIGYSVMTCFLLLAFISFHSYLEGRRAYHYVLFVAFYGLAQFTREQAMAFLPLCLLYELLCETLIVGKRPLATAGGRRVKMLRKYIPPAVIPIVQIGLKTLYGLAFTNLALATWTWADKVEAMKLSLFRFFYPNNALGMDLDQLVPGQAYIAFAACVVLSVAVLLKGTRTVKFFFLWGLLSLIASESMTLFSSARYFYLAAAGYSIFLALLFQQLAQWVTGLMSKRLGPDPTTSDRHAYHIAAGYTVLTLFLPLYLLLVWRGVSVIDRQEVRWKHAATIARNVLQDVKKIYPEGLAGRQVCFVNLPMRLRGDDPAPVGIFGQELPYALKITYGTPLIGEIRLVHTDDAPYPTPDRNLVTYQELLQLHTDEGVEILLFDPELKSVRPWP